MAQTKRVYKYKNIAAALAVVLLAAVAISTNVGSKGSKTDDKDTSSLSDSSLAGDSAKSQSVQSLTKNYRYEEVKNADLLGSGMLILVDSEHPFSADVGETDGIYGYLFDESSNQIMYATSTQIYACVEALEAFNRLGIDFVKQTGLETLMVSQLIPQGEQDDSQAKYDEAYTGMTIDLMLYDAVNGTYPQFTGEGDYSWISQSCYSYGFIMRDTNRLRYVGEPFAQYMGENSLSLEDFLESVKQYSFDSPLYYQTQEGVEYAVYYVEADMESTTSKLPVPMREDNSDYNTQISGNNVDGFIVSVNLTDTAEQEESEQSSLAEDLSSQQQ